MNSYEVLTKEFNELEVVFLSAGGKTVGTLLKLTRLRERCVNLSKSIASVRNHDWGGLIKRIDELLSTKPKPKPVVQIAEPTIEDDDFKGLANAVNDDFKRFLGSQRSHPNVKRNSKPKVRKYRGYGR